MKRFMLIVVVILLVASGGKNSPVTAQGDDGYIQQDIIITASDGIDLGGTFWMPPNLAENAEVPAILLLHGGNSGRHEWNRYVPIFLEAGFAVVATDARGYGQSGGERNMILAVDDNHRWLEWLNEQPNIIHDRYGMVGSSMGATMVVNACYTTPLCATAVSLSPGVTPIFDMHQVIAEEYHGDHSLLMFIALQDTVATIYDREYTDFDENVAYFQVPTSAHGSGMLQPGVMNGQIITPLVLNWLDLHLRTE